MAGGDTGAPRSGGSAQADSFVKREKAQEDMYMKNQEREKLNQLREKLKAQQAHLQELDAHLEAIAKEHGGENK
ncbi:MAG: hypothetical protein M1824_006085 [Vezdaea acicularis]|nr:MAG: hypothetical protein M1824_006085 [Vezdaea acicularis]